MYQLMIADDEPLEKKTLKLMVERKFSYIQVVGEAVNGQEAVRKARELNPDIILLDIKMPGCNGVDAAKQIKEIDPQVKIVIITAYDYFDYAKESLRIGIDDFLLKPILQDNLSECLEKIVAKIEIFRQQQHYEAEMAKRLADLSSIIESELISAVLLRLDKATIQKYLQMLQLDVKSAYAVIFALAWEPVARSGVEFQRQLFFQTIYEKVRRHLQELKIPHVAASANEWLYILVLRDDNSEEYLQKSQSSRSMDFVMKMAETETGETFKVGIGQAYSAIGQWSDSFLEAKTALLNNSVALKKSIHFADLNVAITDNTYPFHIEKQLCDEVLRGNLQGSVTCVKQLVKWFVSQNHSLSETRQKLLELVIVVSRTVTAHRDFKTGFTTTGRYWDEVESIRSAAEIEPYLERVVKDCIRNIRKLKNRNLNFQVQKALEYIAGNYSKELTLEDVASAVSLSPTYLSRLFKVETGENFIDYLTRYRMELARKFLRQSELSIKEISYCIGYNDPNYFGKLFKKFYGFNPSECRND
jgi:two-component system response regulator YesN